MTMSDQASVLRQRLDKFKSQNETKVISVFSGKGGVGKSVFSLNFALALCQLGKKVVLIDMDFGMANIDILLGMSPKSNMVNMLNCREKIIDIIEHGPSGLSYIAGGSALTELFRLDELKLSYFLTQLTILSGTYDYILFDLGAGISKDMLSFILASHEAILVTTTEPTALTDGYGVLKAVHFKDQTLPIRLVINRSETVDDGEKSAIRIQRASKLFLNRDLDLLGILQKEKIVEQSVKSQFPFLMDYPNSKISLAFKRMASTFSGVETIHNNPRTFTLFIHRLKNLLKKEG